MPATPTSLNLDEAVRQWVALGSGLDFDSHVIDASQKRTPAPKGLYATVIEIFEQPEGLNFSRIGHGSNANTEQTEQSVTISWSVQWFRTGARDAARCFQLWAHSTPGIAAAALRGLTLYSTGDLRRLDAVDDYDWEERAGIDMTLGIQVTERQAVDLVESAQIDLCLDGEDEASIL